MASLDEKVLSRFPRKGSARSRTELYRSIRGARSADLDAVMSRLIADGKLRAETVNGGGDARLRTTIYKRVS